MTEPLVDNSNRPEGKFQATILVAVALALITFAVYWPVARHDFLNYDDTQYVTENSRVLSGLSWDNVRWAFGTFHASNWHPITWLSHMLDVELFGVRPMGHHLVNLLLHVINSVLLLLVLKRMTQALWPSAFVAALFALHPLHVESVAWVSERKDVLSAFFFLLTLAAYAGYVSRLNAPAAGRQGAAWGYYTLAVLCFALGLMSKPMLVTLPFVLLLLDFWPLGRTAFEDSYLGLTTGRRLPALRRLLLEKVVFLALSIFSCVLTYQAQARGGAVTALEALPLSMRLENAVVAYFDYLVNMFWPTKLAVFYPHPEAWPSGRVALAALILVAVTALTLWKARRRPYLTVGWLWYLGMLVPVIGVVQVGLQYMADRYTYLPLVGIAIMVAWGLAEAADRLHCRPVIACAGAVAMLCALASVTRLQTLFWSDSETLFWRAIKVTSDNYIAHHNIALAQAKQFRLKSAIAHFETAIQIKPDFAKAHNNLGYTLHSIGRHQEAVAAYREALRLDPRMAPAHNNLANAYFQAGQSDLALHHYEQALAAKPDYAEAHYDLGVLFAAAGRFDEAEHHYAEALRLRPAYPEAHNNWGILLMNQGRWAEGAGHFEMALCIAPRYAEAAYNLGVALAQQGKFQEAAAAYARALDANSTLIPARLALSSVLERQGQLAEAARQLSEVLTIQPQYLEAHTRLGQLLAAQEKYKEAADHYSQALTAQPTNQALYCHLAVALSAQGKVAEAIAQYRQALLINSEVPEALNNLAWLLASTPNATLRHGAEAVRLAEKACTLTERKVPVFLGTLAAAYAEAGRFDEAVATAEEAIAKAEAAGQKEIAARNRELIELYRAGKACHQAPAPEKNPTDPLRN